MTAVPIDLSGHAHLTVGCEVCGGIGRSGCGLPMYGDGSSDYFNPLIKGPQVMSI